MQQKQSDLILFFFIAVQNMTQTNKVEVTNHLTERKKEVIKKKNREVKKPFKTTLH